MELALLECKDPCEVLKEALRQIYKLFVEEIPVTSIRYAITLGHIVYGEKCESCFAREAENIEP